MIEKNIIDLMMDFLKRKWGSGLEEYIGPEETVKQYLSFHFLHGNVMWVNDEFGNIKGILISYPCDESELGEASNFNWSLPKGENCIFVAELLADDEDSRNLLASGFLQRYPMKKKSYAHRRGKVVEIKAHDISENFTNN